MINFKHNVVFSKKFNVKIFFYAKIPFEKLSIAFQKRVPYLLMRNVSPALKAAVIAYHQAEGGGATKKKSSPD